MRSEEATNTSTCLLAETTFVQASSKLQPLQSIRPRKKHIYETSASLIGTIIRATCTALTDPMGLSREKKNRIEILKQQHNFLAARGLTTSCVAGVRCCVCFYVSVYISSFLPIIQFKLFAVKPSDPFSCGPRDSGRLSREKCNSCKIITTLFSPRKMKRKKPLSQNSQQSFRCLPVAQPFFSSMPTFPRGFSVSASEQLPSALEDPKKKLAFHAMLDDWKCAWLFGKLCHGTQERFWSVVAANVAVFTEPPRVGMFR